MQVRAEKPAWYLAVISGALLRTLEFVSTRSAEYLGYLEKGQLPPARLTLTAFEEAFVLEGETQLHLMLIGCKRTPTCLRNLVRTVLGARRAPIPVCNFRHQSPTRDLVNLKRVPLIHADLPSKYHHLFCLIRQRGV